MMIIIIVITIITRIIINNHSAFVQSLIYLCTNRLGWSGCFWWSSGLLV